MNAISQFDRRHAPPKESPNSANIRIGERIRLLRTMRGKTQTGLAAEISISYQQLQKHEKGESFITAERLWRIAAALDFPISAFFEGPEFEINATSILSDEITLREMLAMISAYRAIPTAELRISLRQCAQSLADYGIPKVVADAAE